MKYELYHSPFLQFWKYQIWERKSEPMLLMLKKTFHGHFLLLMFFLPLPLPTNDTEHSAETEIILVVIFPFFTQWLKRVALNKH